MAKYMNHLTKKMLNRLYSAEKGKLRSPLELTLNITAKCPFNCRFCGKASLPPVSETNLGTLKVIAFALLKTPRKYEEDILKYYHLGWTKLKDKIKFDFNELYEGKIKKIEKILQNSKPLDFNVYSNIIRQELSQIGGYPKLHPLFISYISFLIYDKIYHDYSTTMSMDEIMEIISQAEELGVEVIYLAGAIGEPLIEKKKTMAIMDEIKKLELKGIITTNCFYIDQEFVDHAIKIGWDNIIISLDSSERKTHDFLRCVPGAFDRVMEALNLFQRRKKEFSGIRPQLAINFVINRYNFRDVPGIIKIAKEYGVEIIVLSPLTLHKLIDKDELVLTKSEKEEFREILRESANELVKKDDIQTNIPDILLKLDDFHSYSLQSDPRTMNEIERDLKWLKEREKNQRDIENYQITDAYCIQPWQSITVESNGAVRICCFPYILLINENVRYTSLKDIWYGDSYASLRERMVSGDIPAECKYNCLPSIRKAQELAINQYKQFKELKENTIKLPKLIIKFLFTIDKIVGNVFGPRGVRILMESTRALGYRYKDIECYLSYK